MDTFQILTLIVGCLSILASIKAISLVHNFDIKIHRYKISSDEMYEIIKNFYEQEDFLDELLVKYSVEPEVLFQKISAEDRLKCNQFITKAFTPNGDGANDMFYFDMKNIASVEAAIYSQKGGALVYKWNTLDGNWNGKNMSGDDAPDGVYLYSIQAIGTDGVVHPKKGVITINRESK